MSNHVSTAAPVGPVRGTEIPASTGLSRLLSVGPTGIVVATGLSVVEWLLVRSPENNGSVLAALLALTMTAPVVLARSRPLTAAGVITVAALVNGLAFGDIVRCAGAFPAALYIAFIVGAYARTGAGLGRPLAGLGLVIAGLVAQWHWDPALSTGTGFLFFGPPLAALAWVVGLGVYALRTRRIGR